MPSLAVFLFALLIGGFDCRADGTQIVKLAWDRSDDPSIVGYRVHYGTSSKSYTRTVDVGLAHRTALLGLEEGQTYFSAVTAYNAYGLESDYSNEITFVPRRPQEEAILPESPGPVDSDQDGLPDSYEERFGIEGELHPSSDLDRDGIPALLEFIYGSDPNTSSVRPRIITGMRRSGSGSVFTLELPLNQQSLHWVSPEVEFSPTLASGSWDPVPWTVELATPSVPATRMLHVRFLVPVRNGAAREGFYRVRFPVWSHRQDR